MSSEVVENFAELVVLVEQFSGVLSGMFELRRLSDILRAMTDIDEIFQDVLELITLTASARSRVNNVVILMWDFIHCVEQVLQRDDVSEQAMTQLDDLFHIVYDELTELNRRMCQLVSRPTEENFGPNDLLSFMEELSHEPFTMTDEVMSRIADFHIHQQQFDLMLQETQVDDIANFSVVGATKQMIESHTLLYKYQKIRRCTDGESDAETCRICLNDMEETDDARRLPCLHVFHMECADEWLRLSKRCPICRLDIEEKDDDLPADTETCRAD